MCRYRVRLQAAVTHWLVAAPTVHRLQPRCDPVSIVAVSVSQ
jgi:hypothetical protein